MLASPATESPAIAATASGRNSPSSRVRDARATKSPFSVMEAKKSGPSPPRPGGETLTATAMSTGTAARTSSPAWLRRRRKISRSSDRRNLPDSLLPTRDVRASATDIEALPRQGHEHVLQGGGADAEPDHRDPLVDAGRHDLLRLDPAEPARRGPPVRSHVEQTQLGQDPGGGLRLLGLDGRLRLRPGP